MSNKGVEITLFLSLETKKNLVDFFINKWHIIEIVLIGSKHFSINTKFALRKKSMLLLY